jgi:hypothetical protein
MVSEGGPTDEWNPFNLEVLPLVKPDKREDIDAFDV